MSLLPLFLEVDDVSVLVVGGGAAADRKVRALVSSGATVTVLSPVLAQELAARVDRREITHRAETFHEGLDPEDYRLVIAAAGASRNAAVSAWARRHRLWVNAVDDPPNCSALWPAVVDRGELKVAIGTGGGAPVLARQLRARIEQLLPDRIGELVALARRFRDRVAARLSNFDARRSFWERALESWEFAGAEDRWQALLDERAGSAPPSMGEVILVGGGPGAADLLTLRALQVLQTAEVIVHDRLVSPDVLGRARRDARFIAVGKAPGGPCVSQDAINEILIEEARAGHLVCRLKGGDPSVFGRGGEELEALREAGIRASIVPGITAALACAASLKTSLTHREMAHALVLASAHGHDERAMAELASLAGERRTLAIYMGVRQLSVLRATLLARGLPPDLPVALVQEAGRAGERRFHATLETVVNVAREVALRSPALVLVGEVFRAREESGAASDTPARSGTEPAAVATG